MPEITSTAEYTDALTEGKIAEFAAANPGLDRIIALARRQKQLQEWKEVLDGRLKNLNIELDRIRVSELPEAMAAAELRTLTIAGLGRVQLTADVYVSFSENKEKAFEWLNDNGYSNTIQETVNASTIKAVFRGMIKEGKPLPDEIFKITPFTRASIVKA